MKLLALLAITLTDVEAAPETETPPTEPPDIPPAAAMVRAQMVALDWASRETLPLAGGRLFCWARNRLRSALHNGLTLVLKMIPGFARLLQLGHLLENPELLVDRRTARFQVIAAAFPAVEVLGSTGLFPVDSPPLTYPTRLMPDR